MFLDGSFFAAPLHIIIQNRESGLLSPADAPKHAQLSVNVGDDVVLPVASSSPGTVLHLSDRAWQKERSPLLKAHYIRGRSR